MTERPNRIQSPHEHIKNLTAINADLLAALEELATLGEQGMKPNYDEWLTFHDKVSQIARAAIAKARGKED